MSDPITQHALEGAPYLAVDLQPDLAGLGIFLLDESQLDGPDLLGYDASGADDAGWLNIVCDVSAVSLRRGATRLQGPLTRAETGMCAVTVIDTQRRLDPMMNADAVHKGVPFRVRAWSYAPALIVETVQRNLHPDPQGKAGTQVAYASGTRGTITRTTVAAPAELPGATWARQYAVDGLGSATADRAGERLDLPVEPGQVYTVGVDARRVSGGTGKLAALRLDWVTPAGQVSAGTATTPLTGTAATRLTHTTGPAPATATALRVYVWAQGSGSGAAEAVTMQWTRAMVEQSATAGPYFDGSTNPNPDASEEGDEWTAWEGAPHAAPSQRNVLTWSMERWDAVLFTGEVDDLAVQYHREDPPTVTITALDLIGRLAAWGSAGRPAPGVGAGDHLRARAERMLAEMGLEAYLVSGESDEQYVATLAPSQLAAGWRVITDAQDAELGRVWVDQGNQLVIRSRYSQLSGTVWGTLSDVHGEAPQGLHCCIADASVVYGTETLVNRAVAARRIPDTGGGAVPSAVAQVEDEHSQARYGLHAYPPSGGPTVLELQTDAQLGPWGQALVVAGTEPELRVDRVVPDPAQAGLDTQGEAWRVVCLTDLGDRWLFRMHPQVGPTVERGLGVLGIELTVSPETWDVVWHTAEAPIPGGAVAGGWFALDVSMLDEGDVLAPYGGAPA